LRGVADRDEGQEGGQQPQDRAMHRRSVAHTTAAGKGAMLGTLE
jgi:hypothetical protein